MQYAGIKAANEVSFLTIVLANVPSTTNFNFCLIIITTMFL